MSGKREDVRPHTSKASTSHPKKPEAPPLTAAYFCGRALLNRKITADARRCALCRCLPQAKSAPSSRNRLG